MEVSLKILVTGGSGFIGSCLIRHLIKHSSHTILNVDKLTYAANNSFSSEITKNERYSFSQTDICSEKIFGLFTKFSPEIVINLAAESHVDNSINTPHNFIQTNIVGTYNLLNNCIKYIHKNNSIDINKFKFIHISTDEVYGDLQDLKIESFNEDTAYNPSSPYSASKASADHLVKAWHRTYGLQSIIINSANNYGPYQNQEKLIPLTIINAIQGKNLPIYGDGKQIRDWLYVEDHAKAIHKIINKGKLGEKYNIGARNSIENIILVKKICNILDKLYPIQDNPHVDKSINSYADLISYVTDRPGHDLHYAIDPTKIEKELDWKPIESFEKGLEKTIKWYIKENKN